MATSDAFKFAWDDVIPAAPAVTVAEDTFGSVGDTPVQRFTLRNGTIEAQVIALGAAIQAVRAPDRNGVLEDVVLGWDSPHEYISLNNPQFGGTVGRVSNRLENARFTLDGKEYRTYANEGRNTLHGGLKGWHQALWTGSRHADGVTFTLVSPDGDEGFPGQVTAQVTYRLTTDSKLVISMQAVTSKPTPIAMLNHAYFNLAGHGFGADGVYKTRVAINSDHYLDVTDALVFTGLMPHVEGTPMDLRSPRLLGDVLRWTDFDRGFAIARAHDRPGEQGELAYNASAYHEPSGRTLEVFSDQPALHFYSGGKFPGCSDPPMVGKQNARYQKHGAFTLEPQFFPNGVNNANRFPRAITRPGQVYTYNMAYKFGVRRQ